MSPSVSQRSPMGRHESRHSASPVSAHASRRRTTSRREGSPAGSPCRTSPTIRESSRKTSLKDSSVVNDKHASRGRSPRREKERVPVSGSPSPRTKRLRRAQVERETEKAVDRENGRNDRKGKEKPTSPISRSPSPKGRSLKRSGAERETEKAPERENERYHGKGNDKLRHQERDPYKDIPKEIRDRRSGRDAVDSSSSRSRHRRSASPSDRHHRSHHRSHSPPPAPHSRACVEGVNSRGDSPRDDGDDSLAKMKAAADALEAKQKQKPSFELSGKLAGETNRVRGVTLLFTEPPDSRKPDVRWRLYVFKAGEVLNEPLYVHRQSCYLFGRERRVADIPTDHPSCSKQHAVLQYRQVEKEQPDGTMVKKVRPYIMDLGSTNKTFVNDNPIEPQRYYELFEKDTIKFGNSSREYVLLHENSAS
ncbi:hypothetical protein Dimus_019116 [Dionaea muscipula]